MTLGRWTIPRSERSCRFTGCQKSVARRDLCSGHLTQENLGKPLSELNAIFHRISDVDEANLTALCSQCGETEIRFRDTGKWRGWACKKVHKTRTRRKMLQGNYGLSTERYDELCLLQANRCALCGSPPPEGGYLGVDHDHSCCPGKTTCGNCVRGLICNACNTALGMFRDDIDVIQRAVVYLRHGGPWWI